LMYRLFSLTQVFDWIKLPHFDILDKVKAKLGHRLSLSVLAKNNLDHSKIDSGTNAVLYWNQHDKASLEKLQKYCEADVIVTRDLYDFGLKNGILHYIDKWNENRSVAIDFGYPKQNNNILQESLF